MRERKFSSAPRGVKEEGRVWAGGVGGSVRETVCDFVILNVCLRSVCARELSVKERGGGCDF